MQPTKKWFPKGPMIPSRFVREACKRPTGASNIIEFEMMLWYKRQLEALQKDIDVHNELMQEHIQQQYEIKERQYREIERLRNELAMVRRDLEIEEVEHAMTRDQVARLTRARLARRSGRPVRRNLLPELEAIDESPPFVPRTPEDTTIMDEWLDE